ncbi:MAG: DUF4394 domain-containing protein [Bacteroidota bacterium]
MKKTFTNLFSNLAFRAKAYGALFLLSLFTLSSNSQIVYATASNTLLVSFNASTPGIINSSLPITGITAGQTIEGLDFRPNTGELYAFGYNKTTNIYQVYTINITSGIAIAINTPTTIALGNGPIGFDFNPTVDRIRVVSANGGNFRLHPATGLIAFTDLNLAYATGDPNFGVIPNIVAAAYSNSYIGAATTALYNYDHVLNLITLQNPPNNGTLNTIGASGITSNTMTPMVDMDIFYDNTASVNKAYLLANNSSTVTSSEFYTLSTVTGSVSLVGVIGATSPVSNIAVFIDRTLPALMGQLAFAISGNNLISFDTQNPNYIRNINVLTGITSGQAIVGMDFRPANSMLYALGYNSSNNDAQLYTINKTTAAATPVNTTAIAVTLGSVSVGFDFNPTVDRIRVVSNNDMNYRLEPITGTVSATDMNINFGASDVNFGTNPNAGTVAYINSFSTATTTTLYNYDESLNILTTQTPPNNGTLNTIGNSGIMINPSDPTVDMDIYYDPFTMTNIAFLSANTNTAAVDHLYSVNLTTGATSLIGKIGFGIPVKDIAIEITPFTTGIAESKNSDTNFATIYPNPLNDKATISIKGISKMEVKAYDVTGQIIDIQITTDVVGNTTLVNWNTSNLTKGVYFVSITTNNGDHQTIKVIK